MGIGIGLIAALGACPCEARVVNRHPSFVKRMRESKEAVNHRP